MRSQNKRLFLMAALLAGSSAIDLDSAESDAVRINAGFEQREGAEGRELLTDDNFRISIEQVAIQSDELDMRPRNEDDLDRILAQLERPTVDVTPGISLEPEETELVLSNAHFQGRVYDESGARLPAEGLGISGKVPLNIKVRRTGDAHKPLDVRFEVPSQFFDGIDWAA